MKINQIHEITYVFTDYLEPANYSQYITGQKWKKVLREKTEELTYYDYENG